MTNQQHEALVEAVAKLIWQTEWGSEPDDEYSWETLSDEDKAFYRIVARAVIPVVLEAAAKVADEHAQSCLMARGNAGAMNDRHAVWQTEAERLASLAIAGTIRRMIDG